MASAPSHCHRLLPFFLLLLTSPFGATSRAILDPRVTTIKSTTSTPFGFLLAPREPKELSYSPPSFSDSVSRHRLRSGSSLLARRPSSADIPPILSLPPATAGTHRVSNTHPHIVYRPEAAWQHIRGPSFLTGSTIRTRPRTEFLGSVTFSFVGQGLDWRGSRSPQHGQAEVRLDGRVVQVVDAYSPRWLDRQLLISLKNLEHGRHEVEIRQLGTKQRRSTGTAIDVDTFIVWESPARPKRAITAVPQGRLPSTLAMRPDIVNRNGMVRLGGSRSGMKL